MKFAKDDWTRIRNRYEAFWRNSVTDRPLIAVTSPCPDGLPPYPDIVNPPTHDPEARLDWALNPNRVIPRLERGIQQTYWAGDAFPLVAPVSTGLVAIQAAYLGGRYRILPENGHGWCEPSIDDWAAQPPLKVDDGNFWWRRTRDLLDAAARRFEGLAAICIPDLEGGGQILDQLRGTEALSLDLIENPEEVLKAMEEIDAAWLHYWTECNRIILKHQPGYVDWLGLWSDTPYVTVECDFSIMISPDMFRQFFLPSVKRQTEWVGRTIYHLDGEGALRHLDALLALDALTGIQWVPGAGAKPMSAWISLLQRIQSAGKLLVLGCRPDEVQVLLSALRPEGLCLSTSVSTPEEADALVRQISL